MADHEVRLSAKNIEVRGLDINFDVKVDGRVLGTLSVSEGGMAWRPKNHRRNSKSKIPIDWEEFADWAQSS